MDEPKGFVVKRGKALLLTLAAIVFLAIVIFLIAAVPPLLDDSGLGDAGRLVVRHRALADPRGADDRRHRAALPLLGEGEPPRLARLRHQGGRGGDGGLADRLGLFAAYTANFASYGKTYGALASIVVVLLWLWLSALVVLVGAEIDGADEA